MDKDTIYITTSIAYVNAAPHIGFALELVQADALARYYRQRGKKVFFSTGTDEHGSKLVQTATEQGLSPQALADKNAEQYRLLTKSLAISNNDFIRTTDQNRHWPAAQKMWRAMQERGDIVKGYYEGLYCVGCEAFLTEKDLENGKCALHQKEPERIKEENYFFQLGAYIPQVIKLMQDGNMRVIPEGRQKEIINILEEGMQRVSFSRPRKHLSWGIPVPGDDDQVMYVWVEALINYISVLGYDRDTEKFQQFWSEGCITHVIGKDILRFHAGIWPAMLLSAGLRTPDLIFAHGFITSEGRKMSKSLGNVVDPFALIERYGADAVRYYLLREIPSAQDGDFSIAKFEERYTADLANGIGNLFSRVTNMVSQYLGGVVKHVPCLQYNWERIEEYTEQFSFDKALSELIVIVNEMNKMLDDHKPWRLAKSDAKDDQELLYEVLAKSVSCLRCLGEHLIPFLPSAGETIVSHLSSERIAKASALFPRLEG